MHGNKFLHVHSCDFTTFTLTRQHFQLNSCIKLFLQSYKFVLLHATVDCCLVPSFQLTIIKGETEKSRKKC